MLNTDRYNPQITQKMQQEQFIRQCNGINDGKNLSRKLLIDIYDDLSNSEIIIAEGIFRAISISSYFREFKCKVQFVKPKMLFVSKTKCNLTIHHKTGLKIVSASNEKEILFSLDIDQFLKSDAKLIKNDTEPPTIFFPRGKIVIGKILFDNLSEAERVISFMYFQKNSYIIKFAKGTIENVQQYLF